MIGVIFSSDKMLSGKDPMLLYSKENEKCQNCIMDFIDHQGITLVLFGRSALQAACLFDDYLFVPLHSMV